MDASTYGMKTLLIHSIILGFLLLLLLSEPLLYHIRFFLSTGKMTQMVQTEYNMNLVLLFQRFSYRLSKIVK